MQTTNFINNKGAVNMSENVIFCFSGTGNCLDIAKNIAKRMGEIGRAHV